MPAANGFEAALGRQIRELRLQRDWRQEDLARHANVSLSAVQNLERGVGSSLKTVIQVARALDREDWLSALAPPVTISPMRLLRERRSAATPRQRARPRTV